MRSPRVEVAAHAGACFGVQRALELVREAAAQDGRTVCTLGPLIHNPAVVASLEEAGVQVVNEPEEAPRGATVVLRTHGVTPDTEARARKAGLDVLDATCPFVKNVHRLAESLAGAGYDVLVAGEAGHPEVVGTTGHAPGARVAGSAREAAEAAVGRRVGVVAQTTLEQCVLAEVVAALVPRTAELRVHNTICDATAQRQSAAAELAARSDIMVVVGGRNSANTRHLADVCRRSCPRTHHVEDVSEIDEAWFEGAALVGVTAGASTPREHIEAAVAAIGGRA